MKNMKNIPRTLLGFKLIAALALASAGVSSLQAQLLFYTGGNGTLWSTATSFTPNATPVANDNISMRNTAIGTNTFDLATPFTLGTLGVASRTQDTASTAVTTTINLNNGVRNFANLVVGESNAATVHTGNLTLSNGTFNLSSGALRVGIRSTAGGTDATGTVIGSSNLTFNATSMTSLEVGVSSGTAFGADAVGTLNLSSVAGGTISIASLGSLRVGSTTSGTGTSGTGTVNLGNNWTSTTVGIDASNRAIMEVGRKVSNGGATGSFIQTGGSFIAFLSALDVGHTTLGTETATVNGTLTLTGTSPIIDTTILNIGNASNSLGVVTLGNNATLTVSGGNVNVGNTSRRSGSELTFGTSGIFTVSGGGNIVVGRAGENLTTTTGSVSLGTSSTTSLGTLAGRVTALSIGQRTGNTSGVSTGSFTQTGGSFTGYFTSLNVGQNTGTNAAGLNGTLTLTGTNPFIDTTTLNIGSGIGAVGVVTLGNNANLTVSGVTGNTVNIGIGTSTASTSQLTLGTGGNFTVSGGGSILIGRANVDATTSTGSVSLGSSTTSLGTVSSRVAALSIGTRIINTTGLSNGTLTQTGGNFTGYFTGLNVGQVTSGVGGGLNTGTLDLTGVGTLLIDVSGTTNIGRGQVAAGSVTTGLGDFRSGATNIGDPFGNLAGASLNLNKTAYRSGITTSTGNLLVDVRGQVNATVGLTSFGVNQGGITFINQAVGALTINSFTNVNNEGIQFTFENFDTSLWEVGNSSNFESIYFAIRWQGVNRTAALNTLITDLKLSADTSAISGSPTAQVFFQGGDTYYGFYVNSIPEPSTYAMFALGLGALYLLRRKKNSGKPS